MLLLELDDHVALGRVDAGADHLAVLAVDLAGAQVADLAGAQLADARVADAHAAAVGQLRAGLLAGDEDRRPAVAGGLDVAAQEADLAALAVAGVAAEEAGATLPYGCRMGICHTCVGKLCSGKVRDLRTGKVSGSEGEMVRTCVNAPEGPVEIAL